MHIKLFFIALFLVMTSFSINAFCLTAPSISSNALFLYRNSNFHKDDTNVTAPDQQPNGFDIQEAELQIFSDVDPYTRLNLLLSIAPKYISDGTKISEVWGIEPEEAFVESNIVSDVTFKIGKFKTAMGKHNTLHTHAYPFIEAPLTNSKLLGDEGFNDTGVSVAGLLPSQWFSEITLQFARGKGENNEFNSPSPASGVSLVHWKNLFDFSDELTMEAGVSYAQGTNSYRKVTSLIGADLTFKWRPSEGGKYTSLLWATEYLSRNQAQDNFLSEKGNGIATWIQYQFAERWATLYRYDDLMIENTFDPINLPNDITKRNSLGLIYSPSEFSSFKLEYDQRNGGVANNSNETTEKSLFLQANFTIGAHPAHSY